MACGSGARPAAGGSPSLGPTGLPILIRRSGVRKIPRGGISPLVSQGAPLLPPGFVGYRVPFELKGIGSRELAPIARTRDDPAPPRYMSAVGAEGPLSRPEEPRTTQPLYLIRVSPGEKWRVQNPLRVVFGVWLPPQSEPGTIRYVGNVPGAITLPLRQAYTGMEKILPMDLNAKARMVEFNLAVRHTRLLQKRPVMMAAGPAPIEFAQAPRLKPGSPSGVIGVGVQQLMRPNRLRGRLAQEDMAPRPVIEWLARDAVSYGNRRLP